MKDLALEIIKQLGGTKRLKFMIGAKDFAIHSNGDVSFRFPKARSGINYIKVHLNGKDLYDITFGKIVKFDFKVVSTKNDIYCEDLKSSIEQTIGLYLSF